ncbi:MAG: regulator [Bacteroidaceae bacterium]|nr:regulator [Bacteroidaceae bacterium]
MSVLRKYILTILVLLFAWHSSAQEIGKWNVYPSYWNATQNMMAGNMVYSLCGNNLLTYDTEDTSVRTFNCLEHLNGVHIACMNYNKQTHTLVLVYTDGGIDLLNDDGSIHYLPDLKEKAIANKDVNSVHTEGHMAYLCTGFGYIELDLKEKVLRNTYNLGLNTRNLVLLENNVYLGTTKGIYTCPLDKNKVQKDNWKAISTSNFANLTHFDGMLWGQAYQKVYSINPTTGKHSVVSQELARFLRNCGDYLIWASEGAICLCTAQKQITTIKQQNNWHDVSYQNGSFWVSQGDEGLHCYTIQSTTLTHKAGPIQPNSPKRDLSYRMQWVGNNLLVAGGINTVDAIYNAPTAMLLKEGEWTNFQEMPLKEITKQYPNLRLANTTALVQDPQDQTHHFAALHRNGLCEYRDGKFVKFYNSDNSPLRSILPNSDNYYNYVSCAGIQYDMDGNLWMLCSETHNIIRILKADGKWTSLHYDEIDSVSLCDDYLMHSSGLMFLNSRRMERRGFFGFDTSGTLDTQRDDRHILRSTIINQDGTSYSPDEFYCMTEDLDGRIWCGTNLGVFVIEDATRYFDNDFRFEQIKISRNDGSGLADYLLNGVAISCITVDGANRKWIGTHTDGLYLISADGTEMLHHFTTSDSPLISNTIQCVAVHPTTGVVMIGTDMGLCSYTADATEAAEEMDADDILVYPNPVKPDYNGTIAVRGLSMDAEVKILSSTGQLVWSGVSAGGTFTWDGRTQKGRRVASGVYHIVANNAEGKKAIVARIVIIR